MTEQPQTNHHALEHLDDQESLLVEDRLWWVIGRKAIISSHLKIISALHGRPSRIMDIGCGSGGNLDVLSGFGQVIGVEPSATLARRAGERKIAKAVLEQDALELDECREMQLFTMFDVLEHIEDDAAFVSRLRQKAPQKHTLLVSVPAYPFLYGDHDRILHHHRRYTDSMLRRTLEAGGYKVVRTSYFMSFLFPLVLVARLKDKISAKLGKKMTSVEIGDVPRVLSGPLAATLKAEAFLSRNIRFPFGLWLFAVAESAERRVYSHQSPSP